MERHVVVLTNSMAPAKSSVFLFLDNAPRQHWKLLRKDIGSLVPSPSATEIWVREDWRA